MLPLPMKAKGGLQLKKQSNLSNGMEQENKTT